MDNQDQEKEGGTENSTGIPNDFGSVVETLHHKSKLPALRSYQGDVSEFMKEKNESVISVALQEKKREEKRAEERKEAAPAISAVKASGFKINLTIFALSLFLIAGGLTAFLYIFQFVTNPKPKNEVVVDNEIIPYTNIITLANITKENLGAELAKTATVAGTNIVKISNPEGTLIDTSGDFFNFLKIRPDFALRRITDKNFAIGVFESDTKNIFLVLKVKDFGTAFSAMLDWEELLLEDLNFLNIPLSSQSATSTQSQKENFVWKDLIIKNKDTRALANNRNEVLVIYTFLDKNTILITNNSKALGSMATAFVSRSVAR